MYICSMSRVAVRTEDMVETALGDEQFTDVWDTWLVDSAVAAPFVLENLKICDFTIFDSNLLLRFAGSVSFVREILFSALPFTVFVVAVCGLGLGDLLVDVFLGLLIPGSGSERSPLFLLLMV